MPRKEVSYYVDNTCDPSKLTLTFRGTCNCPTEHGVDPSVTKAEEKLMSLKKSYRKKEPEVETEAQIQSKKRKEYMEKRREEFDERGIITALYGTVERKVKCASTCTDHLLVQKRNKLRELLLSEEVAYTREYVEKCQKTAAEMEEDMKRKAFDIKTKQERERQELVQQKLYARKVQDCDPVRPILSQKTLIQVKQDQLWQIQEKYAMDEAKREEEKMYHDLMIKNMLALKENEEENAKIAWQKQKELKLAFDEQMRWKQKKELEEQRARDIERLQTEEQIMLNKQQERQEREEKAKRTAKLAADYLEYMKKEKQIRDRQRKEEEEIDAVFSRLGKIELGKETCSKSNEKTTIKKEMDAFLENCKEMKRQREIEERKFEEMLEELNEMKRKQKEIEKERLKAAKEELFYSVMKGRENQVREKKEKEKAEQHERAREIDLLNAQIFQQKKLTEEFDRKCLEEKRQYAKQLMEQMKQVEQNKKLKKEEQENYLKELKAEEERRLEEIKEILKAPIHPRPHPMKSIIQQNATPNYLCPFPCPK